MLQQLRITNYAIIDHLTIQPDAHLNTITGETGAGKSIIMGALSLILGERADTSVLINKEQKCVVEAHFTIAGHPTFREALAAAELDEADDDLCIIRREISASGKSRAFVNDTPVTLPVLNRLTSLLVDLQQQFGHLTLEDDHFQMDVVDALAGNGAARKSYQQHYYHYREISQHLARLQAERAQWQKESDYKQFLFEELDQAGFQEEEIEQAETQLKQLNHAERILSVLAGCRTGMMEGEQPLVPELKRIIQQLAGISEVMPETREVHSRLQATYEELKDIAGELDMLESKVTLDPALMMQLQERVDLGYRLFKKHAVRTTGELLAIFARLHQELQASDNLSQQIEQLTIQQEQVYKKVLETALLLKQRRQEAAPGIAASVNELLVKVGMPNARISIQVLAMADPDKYGLDQIVFQLDANKSGQFLPIYKAASGGEMSRIMLCIKSLTAQAMHLPTLIFDEVDTGISGEAAKQVGTLLRGLSQHHQIICITHQPQVAARGTCHFFVYKEEGQHGRINTRIRKLQTDERVQAIARMIGGEQPGDAAMQHARELIA